MKKKDGSSERCPPMRSALMKVDLLGVDLVGVDLVGVDLVGLTLQKEERGEREIECEQKRGSK